MNAAVVAAVVGAAVWPKGGSLGASRSASRLLCGGRYPRDDVLELSPLAILEPLVVRLLLGKSLLGAEAVRG